LLAEGHKEGEDAKDGGLLFAEGHKEVFFLAKGHKEGEDAKDGGLLFFGWVRKMVRVWAAGRC